MLVLSRKQSDAIVIGEDIRITVVRIERNQVRLGIEAPSSVTIVREELLMEQTEETVSGFAQCEAMFTKDEENDESHVLELGDGTLGSNH